MFDATEVRVTAALLCLWFSVFIRYSVVLGMLLMHIRAKVCSCEFNEMGYSELITEYASDIYRL